MTIRAIAGLLALNALYLAVGTSVLAALRGWRSAREWGSFAGLAYLLGVSTLGVLWVLLLVVGIPFRGPTIVVSAALVVVVAAAVARARRRPVGWGRSPARVLTRLSLVTAVGIAAVAVFFEALFRAGRLHGLYAFDGWAFWIPKATSIFGTGQLEPDVLEQLANPSYPPLVPTLDAAAFHAMGGIDVVTLHLQYWLFAVGFCAAAAGLLSRRVPTWILWPFLVLSLVAPRMSGSLLVPQADFLLQFLLCTAALLGAAWLVGSASWQLSAVTILLGGCVLTKREGIFLAAVLLVALAVASADRWRMAWPRLGVVALGVAAIGLPWRLWYLSQGIGGEQPRDSDPGRTDDALRLALEVFFDRGLWSVLTLLAIAAVVLAALRGAARQAVFVGVLLALVVLGGAWLTVAFPEFPVTADESVNPIVRFTGAAALLSAVAAPLLLAGVWARARTQPSPEAS